MRALWPWALLVVVGCDCGHSESAEDIAEEPAAEPAPAHADPHNDERGIAGRLSWSARAPFRQHAPSSSMRAAEYAVQDSADASLTVYYFGAGQGGGVDANIDRWVGQLAQPDGRSSREAADITHRDAHGIAVTRIEVGGTFSGGMGPMAGGPPREGWKLLGAIAEGPAGPVFFKLIGPATDVDRAEPAFDALIESIDRQ